MCAVVDVAHGLRAFTAFFATISELDRTGGQAGPVLPMLGGGTTQPQLQWGNRVGRWRCADEAGSRLAAGPAGAAWRFCPPCPRFELMHPALTACRRLGPPPLQWTLTRCRRPTSAARCERPPAATCTEGLAWRRGDACAALLCMLGLMILRPCNPLTTWSDSGRPREELTAAAAATRAGLSHLQLPRCLMFPASGQP
jgi:hypothetical protein